MARTVPVEADTLDFEELRAIVAIAEHGSFQVAAGQLNTSRARLRRKLAALEDRTGVSLIVRVDGALRPTRAGEALVRGAKRLLDEGASLIEHTRELGTEPSGRLRTAMQVGFPYDGFIAVSSMLQARFPKVSIEVRVAENPTELLPDEAEVALYVGHEAPELKGCERVQVITFAQQLLGSSKYFEKHGRPQSVDELDEHRIHIWRPPHGNWSRLPTGDGSERFVDAELVTSDERLLRRLAIRGDCLAFIPNSPMPDLESAGLEAVLPGVVQRPLSAWFYVPHVLGDIPRVRAVVDTLRTLGQQSKRNNKAA